MYSSEQKELGQFSLNSTAGADDIWKNSQLEETYTFWTIKNHDSWKIKTLSADMIVGSDRITLMKNIYSGII